MENMEIQHNETKIDYLSLNDEDQLIFLSKVNKIARKRAEYYNDCKELLYQNMRKEWITSIRKSKDATISSETHISLPDIPKFQQIQKLKPKEASLSQKLREFQEIKKMISNI